MGIITYSLMEVLMILMGEVVLVELPYCID